MKANCSVECVDIMSSWLARAMKLKHWSNKLKYWRKYYQQQKYKPWGKLMVIHLLLCIHQTLTCCVSLVSVCTCFVFCSFAVTALWSYGILFLKTFTNMLAYTVFDANSKLLHNLAFEPSWCPNLTLTSQQHCELYKFTYLLTYLLTYLHTK